MMVCPSATEPPPESPLPAVTVSAPLLLRRALLTVVVETSFPLLSVARRAFVSEVNHTVEVAVNCEVEAFVKFCSAVQKLGFVRFKEIVLFVDRSPPPESPVPAVMVVAGAT